ncbi:NAD-dependent epimerase/dehydratase family protein [Consotaella aegiceratis]|uniref:NAD-dependent epimerase/dehydratase family protein n=1 Tax=Consotaella aegiceratis TaxID=3097961 RepID=UPI002F41FA5F
MPRHAFVIGGTGQIGRAVATELASRGWRVTLSSRSEPSDADELASRGISSVALDREAPGALGNVLAEGTDALIDTIAFTETHADQLLEIEQAVGAFVVISSSSVYRDDAGRTLDEARDNGFPIFLGPIDEAQPTVEPGPETYSTRKVALERRLLDHARQPVTILRPAAIYGPYSTHPREWWFVKRMLDRRPAIPLAYQGRSQFHSTAAANIARLIGVVLDAPKTHILNIADPEAPSVAEIGTAIATHLGYEGRLMPIETPESGGSVGWTPWSVPSPFTLDTSRALALGYGPATIYQDAVGPTCDWLTAQDGARWRTLFPGLAAYPFELFDYRAEDEFFALRRV